MAQSKAKAKPQPIGMGDLSRQGAAAAQHTADAQRAEMSGLEIVNPNGARVPVAQFIDHLYLQEDHTSMFADVHKYMKDPKADCMYVWAAQKDPNTFGKIRSHAYRPVQMDEIRDDTPLPVETHVISGEKYVAVYDLILMEVPPGAVKRLYKTREAQAAIRTAQNLPFKNLKQRIEQESGGYATAELEIKSE